MIYKKVKFDCTSILIFVKKWDGVIRLQIQDIHPCGIDMILFRGKKGTGAKLMQRTRFSRF